MIINPEHVSSPIVPFYSDHKKTVTAAGQISETRNPKFETRNSKFETRSRIISSENGVPNWEFEGQ